MQKLQDYFFILRSQTVIHRAKQRQFYLKLKHSFQTLHNIVELYISLMR